MSTRHKWTYTTFGLAMSLTGILITNRSERQVIPEAPKTVESDKAAAPTPAKPASTSYRPTCEDMDRQADRAECLYFKTLPSDSIRAAQMINDHYAEQSPELHYWIRDGVSESQRAGLDVRDGPCGRYVLARSRLTTPPDSRLETDEIVEVESSGNVLRRWPVPESRFLGMMGDEVLIAYGLGDRKDLALAVATDGRYRVVPVGRYLQAELKKLSECPRYKGFGDSAFAVCSIIREPQSVIRYLIWEGPCT